jgi:outer membrane protein assembly factor BamB
MFSLDSDFGGYQWVAPVVTTVGANPVTYANGVVLTADGKGFLDAYDAATGTPLLHHPMQSDIGESCLNTGGGVAVARNTIYAVCGERDFTFGPSDVATGWVIAYQY